MQKPRAFHVMTKPIGPICNLDCRYCFYLEKETFYPGRHKWQMSDELLESYIRQYIEAQEVPEVTFAWQGGEPTLLGVDFFRRAVELQRIYAGGRKISNAFQTNGTLLNDEWGEFLHRNGFLVGISIDGPADLHDHYRVDKQGRPSFDAVMKGLEVLKKHRVEFNTLTVVSRKNSKEPLRVYRFLKEIGSTFHQYIPLVERAAPAEGPIQLSLAPPPSRERRQHSPVTEWSVLPGDYGHFLCAIFDEWVKKDVGEVFIQGFENAASIWAGHGASLCYFSPTCGRALAVEHNGDLYSCDHYVYPEFKLGNLMEIPLVEMVESPFQKRFGQDKKDLLPRYCRQCDVRFACNGECPKHRFVKTPEGEPGLNYLCPAYKKFFNHIDPAMKQIVALIRAGRPASDIMSLPIKREAGRNDPCPCGSGKKHKLCCLRKG